MSTPYINSDLTTLTSGQNLSTFTDSLGVTYTSLAGTWPFASNTIKGGALTGFAGFHGVSPGGETNARASVYKTNVTPPIPPDEIRVAIPIASILNTNDNVGFICCGNVAGTDGIVADYNPNAGTLRLYQESILSISSTAVVTAPTQTLFLRYTFPTSSTAKLWYSTTSITGPWTASSATISTTGLSQSGWVGLSIYRDTNGGSTTAGVDTLIATYPAVGSIAVNDANIIQSPYNWNPLSGPSIETVYGGAYLRGVVTGTTIIGITIDQSTMATPYTKIKYSVNNAPFVTYNTLSTDSLIVFATGLSSGANNTFEVWVCGIAGDSDRWTTPSHGLKLTGFAVDIGGSSVSPVGTVVARRPNNIIVFGDSISEGAWALGTAAFTSTTYIQYQDPTQCYVVGLMTAMNAEVGFCATGGQHWDTTNPNTHVPGVDTAYPLYYAGNSRLTAAKFSPVPDQMYVNMGANDSGDVSAAVVTTIQGLRAAANATTPLFIWIPFGHQVKASITTGFTTAADSYSKLLDDGDILAFGLGGFNAAGSKLSFDQLHPAGFAAVDFAGPGIQQAQAFIDSLASVSAVISAVTKTATTIAYTLIGTGTAWAGTPFSLISGGTASISSQVVSDTTHAVVTITFGSNTGPYTLSDGTNTFELPGVSSTGGGGSGQIVRTTFVGV